ncbi:hypothetical protein QQZ08_010991 [Neonectria magnoliae]|uniref:Uncharacterized protein n=1 Tax=Neonectria magnoliae TaxID=2732573 RepID=A0ABR1HD86_9HYPO
MQRQSNRQSAQPRNSIEYDALDYQEPLYQHDTTFRCKFLKYPRHSSNKKEKCALVAFLAVAVAFTVKFLIDNDNTGFDPHSPDFALYKNSRFQECLATVHFVPIRLNEPCRRL